MFLRIFSTHVLNCCTEEKKTCRRTSSSAAFPPAPVWVEVRHAPGSLSAYFAGSLGLIISINVGVVEIVRAFDLKVVARGKPFRSALVGTGTLPVAVRRAVLLEKAACERETTRTDADLKIGMESMIPALV